MFRKSILLSSAALAAAMAPGVAYAQASGAEAADDNTIVVTAQFREQNLQDTPLAITAVTGDMLADRGITSLDSVGRLAPNVSISATAAVHGPAAAVYIRGIGQYDSNPAFEPGVGIYFDDVYHGALNGSFVDLFDIERIEILRGPQGTLSGKNSIGGSVRIFTRRPEGDNSGYVEATYGTDDFMMVRGAFDVGLSDTLALRVSGMHKQQDGFIDLVDYGCAFPASGIPVVNVVTANNGCEWGTLGGKDVSGLAAALRWQPTDGWDVQLSADIVRDDSEMAPLRQVVTPDRRFVSPDPYTSYVNFKDPSTGEVYPNISAVDTQGISLNIQGDLTDNLSITSITSYREMLAEYTNDEDSNPLTDRLNFNRMNYDQFSQELRLSGVVGEMLDWTVGGYYFESSNNLANRIASGAFFNFNNNDLVEQTSKSVFAHGIVHLTDALNLTAGIRYTDDEKSYLFHQYRGSGTVPTAQDGRTASYIGDHIDYRLGVDYRFSPDFMVYGQFSTGYKGGGTNPRPVTLAQIQAYNPETLQAWEVGFKSDLLDRTLRFNVSAFYNEYSDIILIDSAACCGPVGGPDWAPFAILPRNAGTAEITGIEAELFWEPVDRLIISAGGGLLDFKYTSLTGAIAGPVPGQLPFIAPYTAEFNANASISYGIDMGNSGIVTPRLDMTTQSHMYSEPNNAITSLIRGYTLFNAALGWESADDGWGASLNVRNLFDKEYYGTAFDATPFSGTVQHNMGRPREWMLTVRRNF